MGGRVRIPGVEARLAMRRGDPRPRRLPDLFVVGAQKAGTTALYNYLTAHPDVTGGVRKEPQWFSYRWGRSEQWYGAHFPVGRRGRRIDASPSYLLHPAAAARVASVAPDASIVIALRDPVERAWSQWRHNRRAGVEPLVFAEALAAEDHRLAGEEERLGRDPSYAGDAHRRYSYVARGRYAAQVARFTSRFERTVVIAAEDLAADPASTFASVVTAVGLGPAPPPAFARFNEGSLERPDPDGLSLACERLAGERAAVEDLLKRRFPWATLTR